MASEKTFENQVKKWLTNQGIYAAGTPEDKMEEPPCGWFLKMWGGGQYQKTGIPDLLINANGFFIGCELKGFDGSPSELQKKNVKMINAGNGIGVILYPQGFEEFKNIVRGCLRCNGHIQGLALLKAVNSSTRCVILIE